MKKITFGFFMMILPFLSFAQIDEGFEGATFPPTTPGNWLVMDNGVNGTPVESWKETTIAANVHSGTKAAFIERENIGNNNTSQDWLVTPQITILPNGELKFFTKQTIIGNQGTTYQVRISTDPVQSNQAAYTTIQTWSETALNTTYNVYEEKIVGLNAYVGQAVYIAFVKINTQIGFAPTGDRWLIDDVQVVQKCLEPTLLGVNAASITPTSATLTWTQSGTVANWEVEVLPTGNTPQGTGVVAGTNTFPYSGLTPGTTYQFYVRAHCSGVNYSQWVGPFSFTTTPAGSICSSPIIIGALPFSQTSNTNLYGDEVDTVQGAACGATPVATNYLQGAEVFYSYTPTVSGNVTISMTPTGASSSIFVYNGCGSFPGTCIAGVANTASTPRIIQPLAVTAGTTYIIVISSSTTPAGGIPYTLIIQDFNCTPPANVGVTNIGTTTADISWTNPTAATSWEIAIQTAGSPIPTGAGVQTNINTNYPATGLTAATPYQYWVRADCGSGVFSPWAGPYTFNTNICNAVDRCNYTFRMTDTFGDGWEGGRMEVRQNGIVVATIGATITGAGPTDVIVPLCQTIPFELYWTIPGNSPGEVGVSVINNFAQVLFTKPAGTGSASTTTPLYGASFDCATPACLPPTVTAATAITTTGATLNWTSPGATMWDVYLVTTGQPAPTAATVPTYNDVTTNTFPVTGLNALTTYQYYVRVVCSGTSNSIWAGPISFTTLPTCPQPINLTVTGAGLTTATLGWTETGTATQWEVFIQAPGAGVPTGTGILTSSTSFLATGLTSATNYEFYVRAICSPTDMSTLAGPRTFKTAICDAINQCNYTFTMRDSFGDGWNGNTMTVSQNGIVIATLTGPVDADNLNPISVVVPMCTNLPFELFWNAGGSFPGEVGISVTNQASVIIYNKPFNTGTANTLLFTDVVECTPLPCGRPITLGANTVTQTTANLTWVQPGAPGTASSWEVIVQPIPLGYPTGAGTLTTTNSYSVTGLTAASSYEFYVRTNCGTDGFSNWSGPFVFNTPVANDECINAIVVIANDDTSCTHNASGSVIGATASLPATNPVCAGTANDDVWFQFTAIGPKHYIAFSNISGGGDLNHAIYTGTSCATMTQLSCQNGTGVTQGSVINGLIPGNTYYIRVWTATATPNQTTTFNICIGTVSTCESADAFCSDPTNPFIFPNTVNVPSEGAQSCLGTNPNPTYYFMSVLTPGNLNFQIVQNTAFDAGGNPTGTGLDVDFIAWGPFASNTAACGNLIPANQVGCSYSIAPIENFNITGALAGQVYVVVITNFNNGAGFIKFGQTNQGAPGAGTTDCSIVCEVDLGPDQNLCGVSSVILDSQLVNAAATYRWYRNGVLIPTATSQTYTVTQSGTYRCVGICGPNDVEDTVVINLGPSVIISDPVDYAICDDPTNDGIATFDLSTITPTILAGLDTNYTYNVGYYYTEADALLGNTNTINPGVPYLGGTQTIYIRVSAVGSPQCNTILVQNLVVKPLPVATIASSDADNTICSNDAATITVTPTNFVIANATYSWTLNSVAIAGTTNQIVPTASGTYEVTINLNGCTSTLSLGFTVNTLPAFTLSGTNLVKCVNETAVITVVPSNFAVNTPGITYTWTHDAVLMPTETSSTISTTGFGTFEVTVNNQGCSTTHSIVVGLDVAEIPINTSAECVGSNYIITSAPVNGSFDTTPGAVTYEWFNENDLTTNIGDNLPKFNVTEYLGSNASVTLPVTIVVKITTIPDGCTDTQTFRVVNASCIIQKGISPNGDGDNEEFDLTGLGVKQLSIFNRYGSKVYSLANYTNEWKGQSDKGETLPDGTYYYVIDQTSGEVKTGWIYINK